MSVLQAIFLGILQGVTEFLPVSSSGHLVAAQALLGVKSPGIFLEVSLHLGTLVAVLLVFGRDLAGLVRDGSLGLWLLVSGSGGQIPQMARRFPTALAIVVGSVPAAAAGLLLKGYIEPLFEGNLRACSIFLSVTGLILLFSRYAARGEEETVTPLKGLLVGLAQACALLPGISRSGSTIVTGLFVGLDRRAAARFAFLLAVPAIAGAMGLEIVGGDALAALPKGTWPAVLCGTVASAAVGTISLLFLMSVVERGKLHLFAVYCIPAGAFLYLVSFLL